MRRHCAGTGPAPPAAPWLEPEPAMHYHPAWTALRRPARGAGAARMRIGSGP
jgi:hypothetical protein